MWDKLVLAARVIAAIENPADVCIISARQIGQRAVLKYAKYTGNSISLSFSILKKFSNKMEMMSHISVQATEKTINE